MNLKKALQYSWNNTSSFLVPMKGICNLLVNEGSGVWGMLQGYCMLERFGMRPVTVSAHDGVFSRKFSFRLSGSVIQHMFLSLGPIFQLNLFGNILFPGTRHHVIEWYWCTSFYLVRFLKVSYSCLTYDNNIWYSTHNIHDISWHLHGSDWNLPTFLGSWRRWRGWARRGRVAVALWENCGFVVDQSPKRFEISSNFLGSFCFFYLFYFFGMLCCFFGFQQTVSHLMFCFFRFLYFPGTQITPVLIGKGLLLEGWNPKIEDKQVRGIYTHIHIDTHIYILYDIYILYIHIITLICFMQGR